jgi:DNA-binding transcriptional regulator YdaS (Cro superfamily)
MGFDMHNSQPQVETLINLGLVVPLNQRFHDRRMEEQEPQREPSLIGKVILRRLKEMTSTQSWLAETVGVSVNAVSKWIWVGEISALNAKAVADALEITLDELLAEEIDPDVEWSTYPPALKRRLITLVKEARGVYEIGADARSAQKK